MSFWTNLILFCFVTCLSKDGFFMIFDLVVVGAVQEIEIERVFLGAFWGLGMKGLRDGGNWESEEEEDWRNG